MNIKIEHGIPITKCSTDGEWIKLVKSMKTGDSFVCSRKQRVCVLTSAWRQGIKLVSRKISDTECRVWRVN